MNEGQVYILLVLLVIYLPLVVTGFRPGSGIWKFLAFAFCTLAIIGSIFVSLVVGVLCWLIAWVFGGIALGAMRRTAREDRMLKALEEQNRLLQQQQIERNQPL
jgi:ABC-type sulfate transport system permease component